MSATTVAPNKAEDVYSEVRDQELDRLGHVLELLERVEKEGWTPELTLAVITVAQEQFTGIARKFGLKPEDIMSDVWEFWATTPPTGDLWEETTMYLSRRLGKEASAQRRLTSVEGLRRQGAKEVGIDSLDDVDELLAPDPSDEPDTQLTSPGLMAARQVLILSGMHPMNSTELIDFIADHVTDSKNMKSAVDSLSRDTSMADAIGLSRVQWRALVGLVLGTTRGQPGLYELIARGHPNPRSLSYVRRQIEKLLETK